MKKELLKRSAKKQWRCGRNEQFLCDGRDIRESGYQPVFKDWELVA